jgi:hypothetical protein
MEDVAANSFQVRPAELSTASRNMGDCASELDRTRNDVALSLPSTVFGLLPEAAELAAALERCVQRSTTDLSDAMDLSANLGHGLASCAQNYTDLDTTHANRIGRVIEA